MRRYICDVLVIGAGGAGLMAACEAAKSKVQVAVVNKGYVQHTGATIMAPGAIAAVGDKWKSEMDSKSCHFKDTIVGGGYMNNQEMVRRLVDGAEDAILEMERLGAFFERDDEGNIDLRTDGGHSFKRSLYYEDHIGRELVRILIGQADKLNIPMYENIMITRVIKKDGALCGAAGIDIQTQELVLFDCSSVIVSTGGIGFIYENSDLPFDLTGDGLVIALDAGLRLSDMEFVQFYPLGYLWPPSLKGLFGAFINHLHLLNNEGRRFMADYNPEKMELSTRDILSSAMVKEVKEGRGSPRGGVYANFSHMDPKKMEKDMPGIYETYRRIGFDYTKDSLEIAPTAHFSMGGIEVNEDWETKVPGFFAAGEVCAGAHGANRVSQNALTDIIVSGKIAGASAGKYSAGRKGKYTVSPEELDREKAVLESLYTAQDGMPVSEYRDAVKKTLWEKVGVLRDGEGLEEAVRELYKLRSTPQRLVCHDRGYNREVINAIENKNMVDIALIIALSAKERRESRGAHIRSDYPNTDNKVWLKNIFVHRNGQDFALEMQDVDLKYCRPEE